MKKFKKLLFLSIIFVLSIIVVGCGDEGSLDNKSQSYKVIFNSKGGTTVKTQIVEKGKKVKKPADPKKEGYIFDGWYFIKNELIYFYDFDNAVSKNITLVANWKIKGGNNASSTIKTLSITKPSSNSLIIDNITKAKKEIKDFDVVSANPTLQETAVDDKCSVEWQNKETLNSIVRDVADTKVYLTAIINCGSTRAEVPVVATIKKSTYTYSTVEKGIVTVINVSDATNYTISNDSTTAKYLEEAHGAQILTTFHNDGTSYLMWFNDINTKFVVKAGA